MTMQLVAEQYEHFLRVSQRLGTGATCLAETVRKGSIRFGTYELDLDRRQLIRDGVHVHLQPQPLKALALLATRAGQLVSRQEIQNEIWPGEAAGDFDARLNFCIRRIREALNDDPDHPRYIKTIRKDGYLFIAAVELPNGPNPFLPQSTPNGEPASSVYGASGVRESPAADELNGAPGVKGEAPAVTASRQVIYRKIWLAWPVVAAAVLAAIYFWTPAPRPYLSHPVQLKHDGREKDGIATDGQRIYTTELVGGQWELVQIPISGGTPTVIPTPFAVTPVDGISPDGSKLLIEAYNGHVLSQRPLWVMPAAGGTPQRVGNMMVYSAAWSPDGARIAYGTSEGLWTSDPDGGNARKIASFPGAMPIGCRWSLDGRRLRSAIYYPNSNQTQLEEMSSDGTRIRTVSSLLGEESEHGSIGWSPDGAYFLFCSAGRLYRSAGSLNPGGLRLDFLQVPGLHASVIETGVLRPGDFCFTPKGDKLLALRARDYHTQLMRFQTSTGAMAPYLPGLSAIDADFSRDGRWMAWVDVEDSSLWRSRSDGSHRVQITAAPMNVELPRWSPDDRTIAFTAHSPGHPWRVYVLSAEGGQPHALVTTEEGQGAPTWSPDGQRVMFGHVDCEIRNDCPVEVFNLKTQTLSQLPGSKGLRTARWSPDGWHAAAMNPVRKELWVFDFRTRKWKVAARDVTGDQIEWSRRGHYIYSFDPDIKDPYLFRVRIADMAYERVGSLKNLALMGAVDWFGIAPDGSLILSYVEEGHEIYAYDWNVTGGR